MIWELRPSDRNPVDTYGLGAFLKRLESEMAGTGGPLQGFTFLEDGKRMLALSREIEAAIGEAGGEHPLYVGFQNATKLAGETKRYVRMRNRGVVIYAFGEETPTADAALGVDQWCRLDAHHARLENQWYLVTKAPEPIAFVGWEVSADAIWGQGGISYEGKQFTGFISADARVVEAIVRHLERVRAGLAHAVEGHEGETPALMERLQPKRALALVDDGHRPELARTLSQAIDGCVRSGATLYLYDLSSASYLTSPYPDDEDEQWHRPLEPITLRNLGRGYLADLLEKVQRSGIESSGILPYAVGFAHLAQWCRDQAIDLVVLPVECSHPSLLQRLQGFTVDSLLSGAKINVVIDDAIHGSQVTASVSAG